MSEYIVEVSRKVSHPDERVSILITPCEENPDYITIRKDRCELSKEWYGDINLSLPSKMAKALAEAILRQVGE